MNGFIARAVAGTCLTAGLVTVCVGCYGYADVVDPCYPQRYDYAARKEVCECRYQQVHDGHILDQTVWNWQFERDEKNSNLGTAVLNPAGMDHLIYLIRRRPCPDACIYLATAEDCEPYTVKDLRELKTPKEKQDALNEAAEKFANARRALDAARMAAIYSYVNAQTQYRGVVIHVVPPHDPAEPYLPAETLGRQILTRNATFTGTLGPATGGAAGGAAPAPAAPAGR